ALIAQLSEPFKTALGVFALSVRLPPGPVAVGGAEPALRLAFGFEARSALLAYGACVDPARTFCTVVSHPDLPSVCRPRGVPSAAGASLLRSGYFPRSGGCLATSTSIHSLPRRSSSIRSRSLSGSPQAGSSSTLLR